VTKIRLTIYLLIFTILIIAIVFSILKLNQKNHSLPQNSVIPIPTETKVIDWVQTTKLIQDCQIKVIFQSRNLQVNLRDKNNQTYQTQEPKFNDIVKLTQEWQGPCDLVQTVTE
jgi:hypothetical protein